MKYILLTVSILLSGTFVHAQWYFETSITNNQLVSYERTNNNQVAATPTDLKSINGIRDLSLGLGYLFTFQTLEQRMAADFKTPFVRLGLGLGFEQFTLRTNAIINNGTYPNVYAMAQAQEGIDNWAFTSAYEQNNVVINNNIIYQANDVITASTPFVIGTTGATWTEISADVSAVREWTSNTNGGTYAMNDIVNHDGDLYRNKTGANTDTTPDADTTNCVHSFAIPARPI